MNSWYEFWYELLEFRNMLMNSGRSPNICKVMTKGVMNTADWIIHVQRLMGLFRCTSRPSLGHLFTSVRWWVPGDATSTAEGRGPTGMLLLVCIAHVLHLKATRTSGLCESSKPLPICRQSAQPALQILVWGEWVPQGRRKLSIELGNVSSLTLHKEQWREYWSWWRKWSDC